MNRFDTKISQQNFKKIAVIFVIAAAAAAIGCAAAAGIVFRERIAFAFEYSHVKSIVEKNGAKNAEAELGKLAASSADVVDILIPDADNKITYSAKNSVFASGTFKLSAANDKRDYLMSDSHADVIFRYVKGDEFMLNSVFNKDFGEVRDQYKEETFFENGNFNKTVYMLSFIGHKDSSDRIYIISKPTSVPGGNLTLKIIAATAVLLFMIYWVLMALWIYQNALRSKLYPIFWGIITLITNFVGAIVYFLYKRGNATCPSCGASQSRQFLYCTACGSKLCETCPKCGAHINKKDEYCHGCGRKIN